MNQITKLQTSFNKNYQKGNLTDALKALLKITQLIPFNADVAGTIAHLAVQTDRKDATGRLLQQWAGKTKLDTKEAIALAKGLSETGFAGWALAHIEPISDEELARQNEADLRKILLRMTCQFKEAMPYIEATPKNSAQDWIDYATGLSLQYDENFFKAEQVFDELLKHNPDHVQLQYFVCTYYTTLLGQFEKGMHAAHKAAKGDLNPLERLHAYSVAIESAKLAGKEADVADIHAEFLDFIGCLRSEQRVSEALLNSLTAYVKFLAGHDDWRESLANDASLERLGAHTLGKYGRHAAKALKNFRCKLSGKDVCILLPGPSVKELAEYAQQIKATNPDVIFGVVNKAQQIQETILGGLELDIFACTTGETLRAQEDFLLNFLEQRNSPLLISSDVSLKSLSKLPNKPLGPAALVLDDSKEFSSTPEDPLRNLGCNGLYAMMIILLIGQPKRIFLFGADGASAEKSDYFFAVKGEETMRTDEDKTRSDARNVRLILDSMRFNLNMPFQLANTAALFGLDMPEVYNVNTNSKLDVFEQIPMQQAVHMLQEERT